MTHDIIGMKDFIIRRWVTEYFSIKESKGARLALFFVRQNVPAVDQEIFGEYVRAHNKELLEDVNKKLKKGK